jgi:hypothetical protein
MARTIVTRSDLEAAQLAEAGRKRAAPAVPLRKLELAGGDMPGAPEAEEAFEEGAASAGGVDGYFDRLAKYIPGESVALYVTLGGIVEGSQFAAEPGLGAGLKWGVFGFALLFTPFYLAKVAGVSKGSQIVVSTVSFVVWALAIGGALQSVVVDALEPALKDKAEALVALVSSISLVAFTALVPVFAPDAQPVREAGSAG